MSDQPMPLWKELPLPSEEDRRLLEEWARRQEEEERRKRDDVDRRVIIIDIQKGERDASLCARQKSRQDQ